MKPSVYQLLKASGVPTDHHESDLYAKVTTVSALIIKIYHDFPTNVKTFRSNIAPHDLWYDIPFHYDPFWENLSEKKQ